MKNFIPFLLLTFLWSCGNGDMSGKIAQLEAAHAETPTTEVKKELLASYTTYLNELNDDAKSYSQFAHKKAMIEMDLNQYQNASSTLTDAIQNHASGENTNANIGLLSSVLVNHVHANKLNGAIADFQKLYPDPAKADRKSVV